MTVDVYEFRTKLIALEIEICKQLASNDVNIRKRGLKRLRSFLSKDEIAKCGVEDFNRIWTGLFVYVWASDTPLVQEADADDISNLIHCIGDFEATLLFVRGFFTMITSQWDRISHHRTDKFLMFIRRFLRQIFSFLKNSDWNSEKTTKISSELFCAIQIFPVELTQHLNDIFTEELAKVSEGFIPTDALIALLKCFVDCIAQQKPSKAVINHMNTNIFCSLVRQVKLLIKQKAAIEFDSEAFSLEVPESECSSNLDPRPGNAHVFLPYIDFDENKIVEFLEESISGADVNRKSRNILEQIIQMFKSVSRLRQTIIQPTKILNEVNSRESRQKRKEVKFSTITKKAFKRLNDQQDDFGTKKMKKLLHSAWTVTESADASSGSPKTTDREDWTVSDLRKKGRVSFREETDSFTYEVESCEPLESSSMPISVPRSACNRRQSILCPTKKYNIVDFSTDSTCENNDPIQTVSPEKIMCIEPPWTSKKIETSDSMNAPVKNVRRSTRGKSISLEIPEEEDSAEPLKRGRYSVKTIKMSETVDEVSEVEEPAVQSKKVKRASCRKSSTIKNRTKEEEQLPEQAEPESSEPTVKSKKMKRESYRKSSVIRNRTKEEEQLPEQDESDSSEIPERGEKTGRIKSIVQLSKYEPRKTRSGRIYNV